MINDFLDITTFRPGNARETLVSMMYLVDLPLFLNMGLIVLWKLELRNKTNEKVYIVARDLVITYEK
eukprot:snap_masked-scaffold_60-processed-gene-0.9-mRNA-1 protein AED:1.00 eAED:1.00 QI:0/0/0/0/1/1/2/0/66